MLALRFLFAGPADGSLPVVNVGPSGRNGAIICRIAARRRPHVGGDRVAFGAQRDGRRHSHKTVFADRFSTGANARKEHSSRRN